MANNLCTYGFEECRLQKLHPRGSIENKTTNTSLNICSNCILVELLAEIKRLRITGIQP